MSISKVQFDEEVTTLGIVIILGCGTFFGFYSVSVRHFLRGIHPIVGFGIVSNYVSLATLTGMFTLGNYSQLLDLSLRNLLVLSGSAVLGIAMGHFFLYSAVSRLGAAITAGGQTLIPFPTMLLASWILHESMTGLEWVAGLTMVVGAALLLLVQNQVVEASRRQLRTAEPSTAKS
jgi:drug/metabolite transporter (DMT)-like permease